MSAFIRVVTAILVIVAAAVHGAPANLAAQVISGVGVSPQQTSTIVATIPPPVMQLCADFGIDGQADIIWQHPGTGALLVSHFLPSRGLVSAENVPGSSTLRAALMSVNCMDSIDLEPDLIVKDMVTGDIDVVRMRNAAPIERIRVIPSSASLVVGTGDFNGDNNIDMVLQDPRGTFWLQYMDGTVAVGTEVLAELDSQPVRIAAVLDVNGDHRADLIWQNLLTGEVRRSLMTSPTTALDSTQLLSTTRLRVVAAGAYGDTTEPDLLLQDPQSGELWVMYVRDGRVAASKRLTDPTGWRAMSLALEMHIATSPNQQPTAATIPVPSPPDLSKEAAVSNMLVRLRAGQSAKCVEIVNGDWGNGARMQLATCSSRKPGQAFWLTREGRIVSALGRVLEVGGGSKVNGAPVNMWSASGGNNQSWKFVSVGRLQFAIINRDSGKALDVRDRSLVDGAAIQQWDYLDGENQRWSLDPVAPWYSTTTTGGLFRLVAQHSGKCLDLPANTVMMGAQLQQWDCNGGSAQTFWFVPLADGYRILTAVGYVLDVRAASTANGAAIQHWEWAESDNQKWIPLLGPAGSYALMSRASGKMIDVTGGPTAFASGPLVQQWAFLNGANQMWRLERVVP